MLPMALLVCFVDFPQARRYVYVYGEKEFAEWKWEWKNETIYNAINYTRCVCIYVYVCVTLLAFLMKLFAHICYAIDVFSDYICWVMLKLWHMCVKSREERGGCNFAWNAVFSIQSCKHVC